MTGWGGTPTLPNRIGQAQGGIWPSQGSLRLLKTKKGDRMATFHREADRKGTVYRVAVDEKVPNLGAFAEPMSNLGIEAGSAR